MSQSTLEAQTEATLSALQKAQSTGIVTATGAWEYDLTGVVSLIPVVTPFRNKVPREANTQHGSPFAIWRAFVDVTRSQARPTPGNDYAANEVLFYEQDFQAKYRPVALAGLVTQDALDYGKGLFDAYAKATMGTLNQTLIGEEKILIGGQSFALVQAPVPTLTASTSAGSIATGTVYVGVAARTSSGYYYGGNSRGNSASVAVTGPTASVIASIPATKGAAAYDWFYSANGTTWFYVRTTTVATTVITATTAANGVPSVVANPDIASAVPTYNAAADNGSAPLDGSGNPSEFDGLIASITGDYNAAGQFVTSGTATANPAVFVDGGGTALTLSGGSITQIENLFQQVWNTVKCSPTALMMNAVQAQEVANLILGSTSATTFLTTDAANRLSTTAGGRVGQIINTPAGGIEVPIEVHPYLPPGTIIARTDEVPFAESEITSVFAVRTLRDYTQFEYGISRNAGSVGGGPRKEFEIRSIEAFINRAPVAQAILVNIA
jgi:hypothetical protein